MPGYRLIRCFVSVDVEDEGIVDRILGIQETISQAGRGVRLVAPENLHLTLRFIGEIPEALVEEVMGLMQLLRHPEIDVQFRGVGAFPSTNNPRVVWVGVSRGASELVELSRQVNKLLSRLRIPRDKKEFTPHLTIARIKGRPSPAIIRTIRELYDVEVGEMTVREVRLKQSTLTPRGPIYTTLRSIRLEDKIAHG